MDLKIVPSRCDLKVVHVWSMLSCAEPVLMLLALHWHNLQTWLCHLLTDWQTLWMRLYLPALDKCLALAQDRYEADCSRLGACLICALYLNWDELLTCGLISWPYNWFSRSVRREVAETEDEKLQMSWEFISYLFEQRILEVVVFVYSQRLIWTPRSKNTTETGKM